MALEIIAVSSDNLVRLDNLANASSGAYINNATVTFSLTDSNGSPVSALTNISMAYVAGTNGRYEGTIPNTAAITKDALYSVAITAVGGGFTVYRKLSCIGKIRADK